MSTFFHSSIIRRPYSDNPPSVKNNRQDDETMDPNESLLDNFYKETSNDHRGKPRDVPRHPAISPIIEEIYDFDSDSDDKSDNMDLRSDFREWKNETPTSSTVGSTSSEAVSSLGMFSLSKNSFAFRRRNNNLNSSGNFNLRGNGYNSFDDGHNKRVDGYSIGNDNEPRGEKSTSNKSGPPSASNSQPLTWN